MRFEPFTSFLFKKTRIYHSKSIFFIKLEEDKIDYMRRHLLKFLESLMINKTKIILFKTKRFKLIGKIKLD